MPIKPENRARYPADWKQIRKRILERAGNKCENCGVPNHVYRNRETGDLTSNPMQAETWSLVDGDATTYIVLTIGHLDHTLEHCLDDNLRAWCQRCHLAYDLPHHIRTAYMTRRAGRAHAELFDDTQ